MKKSDFPDYITLKYYYSNKKTSTLSYGKVNSFIAKMILTSDNCIYFSLENGNIIIPDNSSINDRIVPDNWISNEGIKYCIKYQPFGDSNVFKDSWSIGYSLYSKDFWHYIYSDFLDLRLKISLDEVSFDKISNHFQIIKN